MGFLKTDYCMALSFVSCAILLNLGTFYAFLLLTFVSIFGYITYYYGDFIYRSYLTLNRDLCGLLLLIRVNLDLRQRLRENRGIHQIFLDIVKRNSKKICAIDITTDKTYTFEEFNKLCNHFANYFQQFGYVEGDIVALFMENSVEFVAAWMGLAKIGVVTAWINSNLKMQPLAHCLNLSDIKGVISSKTLSNVLYETKRSNFFNINFDEFVYGDVPPEVNAINLKSEFERLSNCNLKFDNEPTPPKNVDFKSILCFIYTSGTTGMPKAALMKHFRYYSMVMGSAKSFGILPNDRLYISMPLYHTSAGIIGIGQVLLQGSSCAIRSKFSASNFWKDCVKYECTVSQYIGEICRYLLAQPISKDESQHKIKLLYGNGLRAEIWKEFVKRFNVKIGELYGSTEGTSNLVNIDGKIGSCGFLPISPLTSKLHPVRLIKIDKVTLKVLRGKDGLCIPCRPGQIGAMVSTIKKNNPLLIFEGYLNKTETNKKVIYNVFQKNDSAFLTGDILYWDRLGYVYFKDRTGDTFRWKGENVSTTEVEAVLQPLKSIIDLTVYGVTIPGMEGKAGMLAIVRDKELNETKDEFFNQITKILIKNLPLYAIPIFIRLCNSVDKTGTFKLVKTNLQQIGYNQSLKDDSNDDELYIWDNYSKSYKQFDDEKRQLVDSGNISRFL